MHLTRHHQRSATAAATALATITTQKTSHKAATRKAAAAAAVLGCAWALTVPPAVAAGATAASARGGVLTIDSAEVSGGASDRLHVTGTATCHTYPNRAFLQVSASQGDAEGSKAIIFYCDGAEHRWDVRFTTDQLGPRWARGESATIKAKVPSMTAENDIVLT
ncbi:hypothetical protein [Nonomuraea insulae]|uniref:Secreted protein n=1 Tax=Nonomuraea insulae TaxID=1616787 RepID=A0ABW1CVS7_9ACTN